MSIDNLVRTNIKSLKPYTSARDEFKEFTKEMIFLDANENPFDNGLNRYPDPYQTELKKELSIQKNISIDQILIGNGSDEVLDLIFRVFCEPNADNIITLPPTYGMYEVLAKTNAVDVFQVSLIGDFQLDIDEILKIENKKTKLIFVCSPNNPTANSIDSNRIKKLLNQTSAIVVIDEAYIDFSNEESWLNQLSNFPNLIVTQTLSKAYGMAGIRLGTCYASKEIISFLNKIKPPYNVNTLTQQAAINALGNNEVEQQINIIKAERENLSKQLKSIAFIDKVYSSDANFLLVKVDDANKRYEELINKGIVVRNRSSQLLCDNCIRITIGNPKENKMLIKLIESLV